jgi:hypothetical protein
MISGGNMEETELTEELFNERKEAARLKREEKQQAAIDRAEAIANGEQVEPLRRNGKQGAGYWADGVYRMDPMPSPEEYLRITAKHAKSFTQPDLDVALIEKLSAKFPHLDPTDRYAFLTAACSSLFEDDPDRLLGRACQLLESLGAYRTPCGTLVSKYRRLPTTTGSSQSLKIEDLEGSDL